jgi:hypothetical protein
MTRRKEKIMKLPGKSGKMAGKLKKGNKDMGLDKVVPVRLPTDKWEQMRLEASALSIGPTTLARILILDGLRKLENGAGKPENPEGG